MTEINTIPQKQKCNRCKVTLSVDKFKLKRNDERMKQCIQCNDRAKIWANTKADKQSDVDKKNEIVDNT